MRTLTEEESLRILAFLETLVVGLGRLGSRYPDNDEDLAWALLYSITPKVVREAAQVRSILSSKYCQELQDGEELDELEKFLSDTKYWKAPTPKQLANFRANRLKKQALSSATDASPEHLSKST